MKLLQNKTDGNVLRTLCAHTQLFYCVCGEFTDPLLHRSLSSLFVSCFTTEVQGRYFCTFSSNYVSLRLLCKQLFCLFVVVSFCFLLFSFCLGFFLAKWIKLSVLCQSWLPVQSMWSAAHPVCSTVTTDVWLFYEVNLHICPNKDEW